MPIVPFESLPGTARVWVFAAEHPVTNGAEAELLDGVDAFLAEWAAHGAPLRCARDWRENRFLTIAVDDSAGAAGASGCSIDGLYRTLRDAERSLRTTLVAGGRVFFRGEDGRVSSAAREVFSDLAAAGEVGRETRVFDTTVASLADWRDHFELEAESSWHAQLLPEPAA
ncbi:MAG: hypothetical protein ACRENI_14815 [Gemmatimonadaceae bacterium]